MNHAGAAAPACRWSTSGLAGSADGDSLGLGGNPVTLIYTFEIARSHTFRRIRSAVPSKRVPIQVAGKAVLRS
ncbi:MAG: hypothetical protein Tsb0032_17780 [Kiloniellaceae bacterium]